MLRTMIKAPHLSASPTGLFSSRRFWLLFLCVSLVAALVAFKFMYRVMPGLNVDVEISSAQAIAAATAFQHKHFPSLKTQRSAVTFVSDRGLQNYVELEAGGTEVFRQLIPNIDAVTHYWKVRNFSPGQKRELIMAFSPKGEPISYALLVADDEPGAALTEAAARKIAEQGARDFLGQRFDAYKALESKVIQQPSGRLDYNFTYEHSDLKVGEARFRLALKVAGDQMVAMDTFKFIPDAFDQRFAKMRALNTQISQTAGYLMMGVFGLGGLVLGGIWLFRRDQLRLRLALIPALVVATGLAGASLANFPNLWMDYSTADKVQSFVLKYLSQVGGQWLLLTLLFTCIYAVAEGLSRSAFSAQPSLFDSWRPAVAATPEIAGRVLGGYAWACWFLLYAMLFVWISHTLLGWWQPTDISSDPNILASWRPALVPIFAALQAGTWEECLFRAIPLSLAVLLGNRFGIRRPLVIAVLLLQALVFASAHANYPNLPGYSRVVELFIPALVFGLVFLRFGLLAGMICHFSYDLTLMSMPIFTTTDSHLWIDRCLVVGAGAAPLILVILASYKRAGLAPLAEGWRNGYVAAIESPAVSELPLPPKSVSQPAAVNFKRRYFMLATIFALAVIGFELHKPGDVNWPNFSINRTQALAAAQAVLADSQVKLTGDWRATVLTHADVTPAHNFVWEESPHKVFQQLLGNYLDTPYWEVLWKKFDGPVEERTEQWDLWLYPDGQLHELVHKLPEARSGASLTRAQAVAKADAWLTANGWVDPAQLEPPSVDEQKRPARTDWTITYINNAAYNHRDAQAIINISVSGDEVTGFLRSMKVPETWSRARQEADSKREPFNIMFAALIVIFSIVALIGLFSQRTKTQFSLRLAWPWMVAVALPAIALPLLWLDGSLSAFAPTMSWQSQILLLLVGILIGVVMKTGIGFLLAHAIHGQRPRSDANWQRDFLLGSTLALVLLGGRLLIHLIFPSPYVPEPNAGNVASLSPWLTSVANAINSLFNAMFLLVLVQGMVRFVSRPWRIYLMIVLLLAFGVAGALKHKLWYLGFLDQLVIMLVMLSLFELVRRQQMGAAWVFAALFELGNQYYQVHALGLHAALYTLVAMGCTLLVIYSLLQHWYRQAVELIPQTSLSGTAETA